MVGLDDWFGSDGLGGSVDWFGSGGSDDRFCSGGLVGSVDWSGSGGLVGSVVLVGSVNHSLHFFARSIWFVSIGRFGLDKLG